MNNSDASIFSSLFSDAYSKCFGHPLSDSLSETESKQFCNQILDKTGLVIGPKSIKNYSFYIVNNTAAKQENPSVATLDTLARYVLDAPYTDEIQRKTKESHYPYWFQYRDQFHKSAKKVISKKSVLIPVLFVTCLLAIIFVFLALHPFQTARFEQFTDDFHSLAEDSMVSRGWMVYSKDNIYWSRRTESSGQLSLFTLRGDNWPDSAQHPGIRNLLLRKVSSDCFTAEVHLADFVPRQNWQQAGILLLEDTLFRGKSLRLSLAFNDFFGGYSRPKEIIIQAITSPGNGLSKPEEIAHKTIFSLEAGQENLVIANMRNSALRIEKKGRKIRLLYSSGPMENFAFKEVITQEFDIQPNYIGIFALKGFVNNAADIPARFSFFSLVSEPCK